MKKNINKSKIYMIICVCILCISILGSTFAFYRIELFGINTSTSTQGLEKYIHYVKGQNISIDELPIVDSYLEGVSSNIEFWKIDDTYDIYGHIYLDINEIGGGLSSSNALKYALVKDGDIISEGTFKGYTAGDSVMIVMNIPLEISEQIYTVYVWLDNNEDLSNLMNGERLSLTVRCEATMKQKALIYYITYLYASGNPELITQKDTNGKKKADYYYSYQDEGKDWGLMNDGLKVSDSFGAGSTKITDNAALTGTEGNIRYFGKNPNNYIYFNCSDYSNQTDSTCEKWRIIGIVDGKVKLMRDKSIGEMVWDFDMNQDSTKTTYNNNWETASLKEFLNGLYYNRGTTTKYTHYYNCGLGDDVDICSDTLYMNTIGLKNDETRNMISKSIWYLGDSKSGYRYPNEIYNDERTNKVGTTIYSNNPYIINANVGLISTSDYVYGADLTKCNSQLSDYDKSECQDNNWFTINNVEGFVINPNSSSDNGGQYFDANGNFIGTNVSWLYSVYPSLYLNSELVIEPWHKGTSTDPYRIIVS